MEADARGGGRDRLRGRDGNRRGDSRRRARQPGRPAAAAPGGLLPPHVFAPYYFNTTDTLAATSKASGAKYLTLAFLQTAKPGSCTVDWNGDPSMPVGKTYAAGIAAMQAAGGNVVPSFGGASADSADEEIADSCHSVPAIAGQYEKVITTYHVTRLDLDTEEDSLNNYAGIDRRNKAIAMVERWARAHAPLRPVRVHDPDQHDRHRPGRLLRAAERAWPTARRSPSSTS